MVSRRQQQRRQEAYRLLAYARELGITTKQVRFSHLLARDPKQRSSVAATALGFSAAWGSKAARDERVQKYVKAVLSALRRLATERDRRERALLEGKSESEISHDAITEYRARIATVDDALSVLTIQMSGKIGDYLTSDGAVDIAKVKSAPPGLIKAVECYSTTKYDKDGNVTSVDVRSKLALESAQSASDIMLGHYRAVDDGKDKDMRPMFVLPAGSRVAIAAPPLPALPSTPASKVLPASKRVLSLVVQSDDDDEQPSTGIQGTIQETAPPPAGTDPTPGGEVAFTPITQDPKSDQGVSLPDVE